MPSKVNNPQVEKNETDDTIPEVIVTASKFPVILAPKPLPEVAEQVRRFVVTPEPEFDSMGSRCVSFDGAFPGEFENSTASSLSPLPGLAV